MTHYITRYAASPDDPSPDEWVQFVNGGSAGDIQVDNDGVMDENILVDLSHGMSIRLGKQMSMMSTYRVSSIGIRLVNQDDANDNEAGANFGGRVHFWTPSRHRVDAMQIARQMERKKESIEVDADSFLLSTGTPHYTGMRFDWDGGIFAGHTRHATTESFTGLSGSTWDLEELFQVYGNMVEGRRPSNYLWYGGRCGFPEQFGWTASYCNSEDNNSSLYNPRSDMFHIQFPTPIEVLGGILNIDIMDSSVEMPFVGFDDDYLVEVTVGIEGWRDF